LPHSFIDFARFVDKFAPTGPLAINPVAEVEVSVRVNVPSIPMVDVVLELALVDDVIDLFSNTLHAAVRSDLTDDELVELALPELQRLVDWLIRVSDDVLKSQWA
jgi:hypothetical protein